MKTRFPILAGHLQRGFSMLEMLGALAIASIMVVGLTYMIDNALDDMKGQQAAAYQSQLATATSNYIKANYTALKGSVGTTPTAVTVNTLMTSGFLPQVFSNKNIYLQTGCVLILQPTPGQLNALVITTGGTAIGDKDLPAVAAAAGTGSGYISSQYAPPNPLTNNKNDNPHVAIGASWTLNTGDTSAPGKNYQGTTCDGGSLSGGPTDAGHLVSRVFMNGAGLTPADYLYRDAVSGMPELNTMNTPILMSDSTVVVENSICTSRGIAVDSNGILMQCVGDGSSGKWVSVASLSQWKDPVDNYGSLPGAGAGSIRGDVRMAKDIGKAFMFDGSTWVALAEDQNGNLNVTKVVHAGTDVNADGNVYAKNNVIADANVNVGADLNVTRNGYINGYVMVGDKTAIATLVNQRTAGTGAQSGDVWTSHDLQASQELHGSWVISDSSITAESVFMSYQKEHMNGEGCNFAYTADGARIVDRYGNPYTVWPMGTIAAEGGAIQNADGSGLNKVTGVTNGGTGRLLVCLPDSNSSSGFAWHYVGS
jgi:prepilin-type N-terminal cleavage/methylation domain-containing protein